MFSLVSPRQTILEGTQSSFDALRALQVKFMNIFNLVASCHVSHRRLVLDRLRFCLPRTPFLSFSSSLDPGTQLCVRVLSTTRRGVRLQEGDECQDGVTKQRYCYQTSVVHQPFSLFFISFIHPRPHLFYTSFIHGNGVITMSYTFLLHLFLLPFHLRLYLSSYLKESSISFFDFYLFFPPPKY